MSKNLKFKERLGVPDVTDKKGNLWKALLAEFIGNALLNFFGCGSCVRIDSMYDVDFVRIALAFGLIVAAVILVFGHVSGGHFNPAVTFACLITGKVSVLRAFFYILAQCLGSIVGSGILMGLIPDDEYTRGHMGVTRISTKVSPVQGFGIELFLGFVLVLVVFAVCDPNHPTIIGSVAPFAVGLTVATGHLATVHLTGSSMNPARSLGSAVISNSWDHHWIYWVGPILGGAVAALIYQTLFAAQPNPEYTAVEPDEKEMTENLPPPNLPQKKK